MYCAQLEMANEKLLKIRTALVNRKSMLFLHDNAKPHTSKMTQEKIKELKWEVLPHPLYLPDLAPSDFHLWSISFATKNSKVQMMSIWQCHNIGL